MSITLESTNIFVAGRFNNFIFSPKWLLENQILESVRLNLGGANGISFRDDKHVLEVSDRHLSVMGPDCGKLVSKILKTLSHTPVEAVGINFSFSTAEWKSSIVPMLGNLSIDDLEDAKIVTWGTVFHENEIRISMEIAYGTSGLTVSFNHHNPTDDTKKLALYSKSVEQRLEKSKEIIKKLLKADTVK